MAKKVKKKELGRGIRALLSNIEAEVNENPEMVVKELSHSVAMIKLDQIEVNPFQPRKEFDQENLAELAESLKVHGLIQPITVRRMARGEYQLISGERRLRASKLAGLKEVPAYIRVANDQEMLEMALVENIQREDLNAIEVAITYQRLLEECDLTHEGLSDRVGKKRSTVTNFLRLLKLPPVVQQALKERNISMGHARALAGMDDVAFQISLLSRIAEEGLSVRHVENIIRGYNEPKKAKKTSDLPHEYVGVRDTLRTFFGSGKVQLKLSKSGKGGQIVIPFGSDSDLNEILDQLDK